MKYRSMNSFCKASTLSLHSLDNNNIPIGYSSGCILNSNNSRIVLSVSHALMENARLALKVEITEDFLQKYYIPNFTQATKGSINIEAFNSNSLTIKDMIKTPSEIDFLISKIPNDLTIVDYDYDPQNNTLMGFPKNEIKTNFEDVPQLDELYFVWGETSQKIDRSIKRIKFDEKFINGMKFKESSDDYYIFELDEIIHDEDDFIGISGSPIFDSNRNLVSLVCGGFINTKFLYGLNLKKYKVLIDLETGKIN